MENTGELTYVIRASQEEMANVGRVFSGMWLLQGRKHSKRPFHTGHFFSPSQGIKITEKERPPRELWRPTLRQQALLPGLTQQCLVEWDGPVGTDSTPSLQSDELTLAGGSSWAWHNASPFMCILNP